MKFHVPKVSPRFTQHVRTLAFRLVEITFLTFLRGFRHDIELRIFYLSPPFFFSFFSFFFSSKKKGIIMGKSYSRKAGISVATVLTGFPLVISREFSLLP